MRRMMWLVGACLLGGLAAAAVVSGVRTHVQAAEMVEAPQALAANPGDVVINELEYDTIQGGTDSAYEWFELFNRTSAAITLTNWTIEDNSGSDTIPEVTILPQGFAVVAATSSFTVNYPSFSGAIVYLGGTVGGGLSNTGDQLVLKDSASITIDALSYEGDTTIFNCSGYPCGNDLTPGHSLERDPAGTDTDGPVDFVERSSPTPGAGNVVLAGTADLSVAKSGPATAEEGDLVAYTIALSNTGSTTATGTLLTDTLPTAVDFVAQVSPFAFSQPGGALVWNVGDVATGTVHIISVSARVTDTASGLLTNRITATTTASETVTANNHDSCTTAILSNVRLYALAPANYDGSRESAAIINLESHTVSLDGWRLNDDPGSGGVSFQTSASIGPGEILWLAQDADGFYPVWGFDADWAAQAITRPIPTLNGTWPTYFFTDAGEAAYLFDASGNLVDALAYGTGSASQGWTGSAVPYKYAGYSDGQVLYRKLEQATSLPVADTNTAADWAQDADDPIDGRKLRYPGWDLENLFFPAEIAATANVTLAVAPEGTLAVVSQTIASAQHTLRIEAYTLESVALYNVISDRIRAGVVVTILLESDPPGGIEDLGKWIAQRLHNPPASSVYFMDGTAERYRYQHAKFILVDDRLALVSTDNLGENSMPSDPIANGTLGHRGFVAVTDSPGVITRLAEIFRRDCDPTHHLDVVPYDDSYAPPGGFTPLPPPDWTTYTAQFAAPLATTASQITVLHAPENALRDQDGLLGLLGRANSGDRIAVMQLNEPFTWTTGADWAGLNPRLQALVTASWQGAEVHILLDEYYDDPLAPNKNTAACLALNQIAAQEGLSLICRLANVTGLGIHAKVFLASVDGERWVHLGSINGTETSNKRNREVALQLRSAQAYDWMLTVFDHDWDLGHGPLVHRILLPVVMRDYAPADYPLITEVFINPSEQDETAYEWVEIYNPGPGVSIAGWKLGDAINVGDFGDGRYSFPAGAQLARGQVIVVAACATNFSAAYGFNPDYEWTDCSPEVANLEPGGSWEGFGLALGNEADEMLVQDTGDTLVDSAAWGGTSRAGVVPFTDFETAFPSATSLKRYPPNTDHDDCSRDFYVSYSPSPGVVAGN
jgi:uncharacterized repeat protein (TIGR01451 family)